MQDAPATIPYGRLMHEAVCGVIRRVLDGVARTGLPGAHHFFITFSTRHPAAQMADWLRDRYPEEMMIVIQNWYDDLVVGDSGFSVTLNFGDAPERLHIPFDSILTFVDPSVEFGWRFERTEAEAEADPEPDPSGPSGPGGGKPRDAAPGAAAARARGGQDADVVRLDRFRRKP